VAGIEDTLNRLRDNSIVLIDIPVGTDERRRLKSVLKKNKAPQFTLVFPSNNLEDLALDQGTNCMLTVKQENDSGITLLATVDGLVDERSLLLTAQESIRPESLREYFRVNVQLPIVARYQPGPKEIRKKAWELTGETVDLSGSGVLALFSQPPENKSRIQLMLQLPEQKQPIECMGHVVRVYRMRKNRYQIAFHFDSIEQKVRDQIISCCLQEQRRQLREKIRVD